MAGFPSHKICLLQDVFLPVLKASLRVLCITSRNIFVKLSNNLEMVYTHHSKNDKRKRKRLYVGTVLENKNLFARTIQANKNFFARTVPAN